ncbi:phenylacetate--CoA ligase family protein [Aquibacillus saliphilus]|uniref:phenylacetate--CoA ligase family protein n=1 Tax=Aquibacillus saliphilus TaxID=1909422 RepID=UPI001CEFCDA2|nr:hypothetical protein [Aquibacillus saliphilus]
MLAKLVFLVGTLIRNKKIFSSLRFLRKTDKWDIKQLEKYQLKKCRELLNWAYNNSEFYREKFNEYHVTPDQLKTLADLKKFPVTEKSDLLNFNNDIQINKGFRKLFFSETSGSTGQPLVFYRDQEWDARHRSAIFRGYSWYNVKPWERNGYFWGYNIDAKKSRKIKLADFLVNRFRLFSYKEEDVLNFTNKLKKAAYLEGYSSMIYQVAKIVNQKGVPEKYNLKMIKGTSEKIFDKYHEEVRKAFGKKIINEYGAAEAGIIAFECPAGNMHITMENVIVEEENGEAIITNLLSKSFPIVRYKLGDYIKVNKEKKCSCGREHSIIEAVMGRIGKSIKGKKDNYPSLVFYYVFKNLALNEKLTLNYQAHQDKVGEILVYVEKKLTGKEKMLVKKEFEKYLQHDVKVELQDGHQIERRDGKMKDFVSNLD